MVPNSTATMSFKLLRYLFFILLLANLSTGARAQAGLCPPNMDFEMGNFTNWVCTWGTVVDSSGFNVVRLINTGQVNGRHTIIDAATAGQDPYGGFPELCPNGSGFSVRLGNSGTGAQAEGLSYTYTIPPTATVFSILYSYAVVLQDPSHAAQQQPRFRARIVDLTTSAPLPCVTFDFTASANLPGFLQSPVNPNVWYKDWTPISLNLSGYAGRTILLEFITSDCTLGGHFGYAYMDVNTNCNGVITGNVICDGDTQITLNAPFGFQSYTWYTDNTFSTILATTQSYTFIPPPPVGSVFPVVVSPFAGFGCSDTLYAVIVGSQRPPSNAGADVSICQYSQTQIGGPGTIGLTYSWTPANQVSNPISSNPIAWPLSTNPEEFIVRTTDILTGCFSFDTVIISTIPVDTSITKTGKMEYCIGDPQAGSLSVNNTSTAVQWYDASGPIAGATGLSYQPTASGSYWAQITQTGCTDSTSSVPFLLHVLPVAGYTPLVDTGCVTSNSRLYTNTSASTDGAMTYVWKFSDGDILQTLDATKTFANLGAYTIELVTTTQYGCKDSISGVVNIFPNGIPDFIWDSICTNRPMLFTNLSEENASPQVNYTWTFNNGGPVSTLKDPLPVTYPTPGKVDVTLELVAIGCANDPKTITKKVLVNEAVPAVRYRDLTVPLGSSRFIHVRDTVGDIYNWRPQIQLSSYTTPYTEFFSTSDDVLYFIDITDEHTCVTTDTMQLYVLKKPGLYLPTAFTPNGDGLNDDIKPYIVGLKTLKSFTVFNRWGNMVFQTSTYGRAWDGKSGGQDQAAGVYVWTIEFVTSDNRLVTEKGFITLIR